MYKKDFINILFVISFPVYGYGCYLSREASPMIGYFVSMLPYLIMTFFYLVDILYKKDFQPRLNGTYWIMILFTISEILSMIMALYKGIPILSTPVVIGKSALKIFSFHAFIVFFLYNSNSKSDLIPRLTFISLNALMIVNLIGYYGLGLSYGEAGASPEARLDLPFFYGAFDGANIMAITCLMMIWWIWKSESTIKIIVMLLAIFVSFYITFYINSRMTILMFFLVLILFFTRTMRKGIVYWASLLTLPILMNCTILLYKILSQPFMAAIMVRSDFKDITTLNGRTYLWSRALNFEWLRNGISDIWLGLGYQGQYFLRLLRDIEFLWSPKHHIILHFHSASLEVLVNQGLFGTIPFVILLYRLFVYYRKKVEMTNAEGIFFMVVVFMLFNVQTDTFISFQGVGAVFLAMLIARASIKDQAIGDKTDLKQQAVMESTVA